MPASHDNNWTRQGAASEETVLLPHATAFVGTSTDASLLSLSLPVSSVLVGRHYFRIIPIFHPVPPPHPFSPPKALGPVSAAAVCVCR